MLKYIAIAIGSLSLFCPPAMAGNGNGNLQQRIEQLEAIVAGLTSGSGTYDVSVNCAAGEKITDALAAAPRAASVSITVNGTCPEDVVIARDDVVIKGPTPGSPSATVVGQFDIISADRVEISDLTIRDSSEIGITAIRGASIRLRNLSVTGHPNAAIAAIRHSFIRFDNVSASGGSDATVYGNDGSTLRSLNSTFTSSNAGNSGPALGLFRMSHARFDQGNTLENTNSNPDPRLALAIQVLDTSNIRIQRAGNTVNGNIRLESNSTADYRGTTINGNTLMQAMSHATMSVFDPVTVNGTVQVDLRSVLEAYTGTTISGGIQCTRESVASGGAIGGITTTGCTIL